MTIEEARTIIRDLEYTEIPFCKKMLFNAETLSSCGDKSIEEKAKRDIEHYREQIRNYENQIRILRRQFGI